MENETQIEGIHCVSIQWGDHDHTQHTTSHCHSQTCTEKIAQNMKLGVALSELAGQRALNWTTWGNTYHTRVDAQLPSFKRIKVKLFNGISLFFTRE